MFLKNISFKFTMIVSLVFLFVTLKSFGTSKYGGSFMETGVGARSLAMGGAFTAITDDVTSIYWNPAGLVSIKKIQIHGMHAEQFAGIVNLDFAGIGYALNNCTVFGIGFFRLGVDGIPYTALRDPSRMIGEIYVNDSGQIIRNVPYAYKYVNDSEMAFVFTYAKKASSSLAFGCNIKVIRKVLDDYNAWGIGFDAGILVNSYKNLKLGIAIFDGTSTLIAWNTDKKEWIAPHLKFGAGYPVMWSHFKIMPVSDISIGFENRGDASQFSVGKIDLYYQGGLEIEYKNRIAFRIGTDKGYFTAGAGFRLFSVVVDYGFVRHIDLGNSHLLSITVKLDDG